MKRALITGIAGFAGSHLAGHLRAAGWEVGGLELPGVPRDNLAALCDAAYSPSSSEEASDPNGSIEPGGPARKVSGGDQQAARSTQSPMGRIMPFSSASGIKRAGDTMPSSGLRQRNRASTPSTWWVKGLIWGW